MKLVMDTENARALAVAYGQQSDEALRLSTQLTTLLAEALVDDTYDVAGSLNGLSEDLRLGDVVLRHQADIMDGLTVDVDALSQEMGVNRWKLDKQLEKVERGGIDAGEVLISLVDFGKDAVTGLDTTIRDFVPDAAPIGHDPEFDALIQRLDGWLLSAIVDGGPIDELLISDGRVDDLDALATLLGRRDLATITVTREFSEEIRVGSDEFRTRTEIRTIPLPTSEHQDYTIDFVTDALIAERKLSRAAILPTLGDLFDFTTYQESYEHRLGQDEFETRQRTRDRTAEQVADLIAEANERWQDLAWLPAVLIGQGSPPVELATDRALQDQLVQFARELGYEGSISGLDQDLPDPETSAPALDFLVAKGRDLMADALENPEPIQKARLPLASGALEASIEFGRVQGVITDETEANARAIALHLAGLDHTIDLAGLDPAALAAEAPELDTTALVGFLATTIPPHLLTENRLVQAVTYAQRADTVADRIERIERTVLGLKTVTTVGEPAMTQSRWLASLPKKVQDEHFDLDIDGKEFNWLLAHDGVPGYHKSPDWRKGKGKRFFHLVNEVDGSVDDFIVEKIPKKQGWFGQAVLSIAKVAISIYFPPMGAAIAAMDAAIAASQGQWLAAGMAALGAVAAGTAAWASSASATAAKATNDAIAAIGGPASALRAAESVAVTATATANTANTAANAAMAVNAGVKAGVAFSQDDILGGVVNSVTALGAGASSFGYANVGQALATGATATGRIADTIEAIEDEDIAGAVASGLGSAASLSELSLRVDAMAGAMSDGTANTLNQISNTFDDAADLTRAGAAVARGIEDEEWGSLVGSGLRAGSSTLRLAGNEDGVVSGLLFDRSAQTAFDDGVGAIDTTRSWLDGAADLADGGLAIAREDYLGGAALLSSGTSGLVSGGGVIDVNLDRLASVSSIADKVVTAGPGLDNAATMRLLGDDVQGLVDSFLAPDPEFVSSGDLDQDLAAVRGRRRVAEAELTRLEDLLAFDTTDGTVGALLGTTRTRLAGELATLERQEEAAIEAVERADAARKAAQVEVIAAAAQAVRQPSHLPTLKPPMPSHLPLARPDDLIQPGSVYQVQTTDGPMTMIANPDGILVPIDSSRSVTTDEQRAAAKMLDRTEQVATLELQIQELDAQLGEVQGQEQLQLRRDVDQLRKRRDGLLRAMRNPDSQDRDYAQYDGSRFIVDDNMDATLYYLYGSDHDVSGESGPRSPVVLGPGTLDRIVSDELFVERLDQILAGTDPQPGAGRFQIDRTWSTDDFHLGRTWVDYWTVRNPDGTLSTTLSLTDDDGIKDVIIPPGSPQWLDDLMGADGLGEDNEFLGRPYLYEPVIIDRITYPDHGQGLAAGGDVVFDGLAGNGSTGADRTGLSDLSSDSVVGLYQNVARPNSDLVTGSSSLGNRSFGSDLVLPTLEAGPYKAIFGGLVGGTASQKVGPDGRVALGWDVKAGQRVGLDGPVPGLALVHAGYAYDDLAPFDLGRYGIPAELPGGVVSMQAVGPEPGVAPIELYDLANPLAWPVDASVRLGRGTGYEHHMKAGTAGDRRLSMFIDRGGQTIDLDQVTNVGDSIELSHSSMDTAKTTLGGAVNINVPVPVFSGLRLATGYDIETGSATSTTAVYGPEEVDAYVGDLLAGRAVDGRGQAIGASRWESHQIPFDWSLGRPSPRFESGFRWSRGLPLSRLKVASEQLPDGTWESTYQSGGFFWDDVTTTTTVDRNGAITAVEVESAVSPPIGGEPIRFSLDTEAYVSVLESVQNDRDPLLALEGRAGIPDALFDDAATRARFRRRLLDDISEAGDHAANLPLPGNLTLRETPRGEPILEPIDPTGIEFRQAAMERGEPAAANPSLENSVITAGEVVEGMADQFLVIGEEIRDAGVYLGGAAAFGGASAMEQLGLEAYTPAAVDDWSRQFEEESLPGTIFAGEQLMQYAGSVAEDPLRLVDDAFVVGEAIDTTITETVDAAKTAYRTGDGHAFGEIGANVVAGLAGSGLGLGAVRVGAVAGRAASRAVSPPELELNVEYRPLQRHDDNLFDPTGKVEGRRKSHVDPATGALVPADPNGTITVQQHIRGSEPGKSGSQFTSASNLPPTESRFGRQRIEINIQDLEADLDAGRVTGVGLVPTHVLTDDLAEKLAAAQVRHRRSPSPRNRSRVRRAEQDLENVERDQEYLIWNEVPSEYITVFPKGHQGP